MKGFDAIPLYMKFCAPISIKDALVVCCRYNCIHLMITYVGVLDTQRHCLTLSAGSCNCIHIYLNNISHDGVYGPR